MRYNVILILNGLFHPVRFQSAGSISGWLTGCQNGKLYGSELNK